MSFAKHADEGIDKGRTDNIANVAVFRGAAGENEGQVLADAVDQVIFCCAVGDPKAGSWSHRGGKTGEAAVEGVSVDSMGDMRPVT